MEQAGRYEQASFAAGCFWDVEAVFRKIDGVIETVTGYFGGSIPDPTYEQVGNGSTGHAEAVGIIFDPAIVSYDQLLDVFWSIHNPTQTDGQGDYDGTQYRSVIFFHSKMQETAAMRSRDRLFAEKKYGCSPILTEIIPVSAFWPAEECHQQFYEKCGQGYCMSRQIDE
jgi:peptide-methionine (S)-S-oxide reductase